MGATQVIETSEIAWDKVKDNSMLEKLTTQVKETTENAQVTWDKVKENLAVEKLTSQVKESPMVEKLTSQMKETTEIAQVTWDKVKESPMVEKLTSQVKETAENAQVAWGKVKESPIVEKLTTQMKGSTETAQDACDKVKEYSTVKNVTAQINESRVWNMAPSSSTLISLGLCLLPSLMFVLLGMLTFHGTFLTVGTGVVFGLLVSSVTVALPVAGVFAGIYLAATKLSALYNLAETSAEPMQSSEETVPIPSENVESESVESEPMEPELENLMESNDDKIDTED